MTSVLRTLAAAAAIVAASALPASACAALAGTTTYDSKQVLVGDPFFGGKFGNARNTSSYIKRTLTKPAKVYGFYLGSGGSDITSDKARILIRGQKTDDTWVTLLDLREAVVNRPFSGGRTGKVIGPVTETFPLVTVKALRVDMWGNGWFYLHNLMFMVDGCS